MKNLVGNNIRRFRQAKGLSQESLGVEVGINGSSLAKIERGETDVNLSRLNAIADVLEVSVTDFFIDGVDTVHEPDYNKLDIDKLNETLQILVEEIQHLRKDINGKKEPVEKPKPKSKKK